MICLVGSYYRNTTFPTLFHNYPMGIYLLLSHRPTTHNQSYKIFVAKFAVIELLVYKVLLKYFILHSTLQIGFSLFIYLFLFFFVSKCIKVFFDHHCLGLDQNKSPMLSRNLKPNKYKNPSISQYFLVIYYN